MKLFIFFALLFSISTGTTAQTSKFEAKDTTSKLPKGLYISNGKVMLKKGYTTKSSKNGKVIAIMKMGAGNEIQGGFNCACNDGGSCVAEIKAETIKCLGSCGCKLSVVIVGFQDNIEMSIEEEPTPEKGWKVFVFPKKY